MKIHCSMSLNYKKVNLMFIDESTSFKICKSMYLKSIQLRVKKTVLADIN